MRRGAFVWAVATLAASGLVRVDHHARRRAAEVLRTADVVEQVLASIDQEERSMRSELDSLATRESTVKRCMLARGRTLYRLVRVGLLSVGGGFDSLLDYAMKMERARRGLD